MMMKWKATKPALVLLLLLCHFTVDVVVTQTTTTSTTFNLGSSSTDPNSAESTTTTTVPPCGPISLLSSISNATFEGNCASANDGETCSFSCNEGYEENFSLVFVCVYGDWLNFVDPQNLPEEGACIDFDGCRDSPCDEFVSVCVDDAAPSLGYSCECKEHHVGAPGRDGQGCSRVTITTVDGNIELQTGEARDVGFRIGRDRFTISELSTALDDESDRATMEESSLRSSLERSSSSLASAVSTTSASLETELSSSSSMLTAAVDSTATSLENAVDTNSGAISANGDAIESNMNRIGAAESRSLSANIAQSSDLSSAQSQLTSAIGDVSSSLETSVDAAQESADNVGARLTANYYTKGEVDTLLSTVKAWATSMFTTPAQVSTAHYGKQESNSRYYTKTQSNNLYYSQSQVNSKLSGYYPKTVSDGRYYTKTQVSSILTNYYTKTEANSRYYTRTQVSSVLSNGYYSKTQSNSLYYTRDQSNTRYYTKSTSDGRYFTRSQADGRYYQQSTLNSRMVFPVNAGAVRNMPLLVTSFVGDDDDSGDYLRVYDSRVGMRSTSRYLEWYQFVHVPYEWYFYRLAVYGNSSSPNMYAYYRSFQTTSYRTTYICGSSTINRSISCNSGTSRKGSSYNFYIYMTGMSTSYYLYGGYYQIRRA
eukprot:m.37102 g.37102  ORF g.37102 m.37102 type:complete len:654 (-) comp10134_c0_seq1:147-2108(-)